MSVLSMLFFSGMIYAEITLPNNYNVCNSQNCEFSIFPFSVKKNCFNKSNSGNLKWDKCNFCLKLFDVFPIKDVAVNITPKCSVVPCGTPFGVKIHSNGIMVTGLSQVITGDSASFPAKSAGLKKGDLIVRVNGEEIENNEEFERKIKESHGKSMLLSVLRDEMEFDVSICPELSFCDSEYKLGIWVRDSSVGIGTLTFYDKKNKMFAGLGHGICDVDTGNIVPVKNGEIVDAAITDISRSSKGRAGELKGCFMECDSCGEIYSNSETGIYGKAYYLPEYFEELEVAFKQDVKKGPAHVICTVEGDNPMIYEVNIDSVNYNINSPTKNIKISITDKELLEKTGGIVQGMSGSPIIQNGKLVGAVTHVLVNSPTKGYGIFAETMLTNCNNLFESQHKNAS
ncbi:MAG: SpoIVB peptidase [Acutalibacteraceae bacterium]